MLGKHCIQQKFVIFQNEAKDNGNFIKHFISRFQMNILYFMIFCVFDTEENMFKFQE